jgi:hypothetical protein
MAASSGPDLIDDGLIFCVDAKNTKSYSGSGSTLSDIGSGVDGTIYNATFDSSGYFNFDGSGDYISLDNFSSKLIGMTSYTLSLWFRYHVGSGYVYLLSMGDGSVTWNSKKLHISLNRNSNKFWWGSFGDSTSENDNCGSAMTNNTIYNVVFNSDGTIYKNGVSDATGKTDVGFDNCQTINYFNIGALKMNGAIYGPQQANARVYQMGIYNRVLTASEVLENYNALKHRFT